MTSRRSFQFLNALRLISAVWVMFAHLGAPPLNSLVAGSSGELVRKALVLPFAGVAAVMVFFVISGFCIHWPFVQGRELRLGPFYLQRLTRIGLPYLAAYGIHHIWGTEGWFRNMLWSVYCEIIYYALYPVLRVGMARIGAARLVVGAFVASWLFCLRPDTGYGHIMCYGHAWTWLVCLPAWLCGCLLSEWMAGQSRVPVMVEKVARCVASQIALTRMLIWVISSVLLGLGIQQLFPFKYSLPLFAGVAVVWLLAELRRPDADSWLARFGVGAYSVFLVHPLAQTGRLHGAVELVVWGEKIVFAVAASVLFYFVIEKPSHHLARWLGSR